MATNFFSRTAAHKHADPAQRLIGVAQLLPDSQDMAQMLATDPAPEVRAAAAQRCADVAALAAAWEAEADPAVRAAIACALGKALALMHDGARAQAMLKADNCTDAIRSEVARRAQDPERRRAAIAGIRDEAALVELALGAERADTRSAAAERVLTAEGLKKLAEGAKNKDRGVARIARQRIDAINERARQRAEADAIIAQLETLAVDPGPILTAVIELDRRWQALDMSGDNAWLGRFTAIRQTIQARFDREQEAQQARAHFERRLRDWTGALGLALDSAIGPAAPLASGSASDQALALETLSGADALARLRAELAALRDEAVQHGDDAGLAKLDHAEQRISKREQERRAIADEEALVVEAEQLAAGNSADNAALLLRWQALNRAIRTPALTRRFEAAMMTIEQRRIERAKTAKLEVAARWQRLQGLLDLAEQSLVVGQFHPARATAEEIKALMAGAGEPPKADAQRFASLVQQLAELERWESFGQQSARQQLCERAEALPLETRGPSQLAAEVRKLRNEWKALDQQHSGIPRSLWQRFDAACEKAYAPAAGHFAEQAALRKKARQQRDAFLDAAAAQVPALLGGPRDWRAIERWLRNTDREWGDGKLGGLEPGDWKKLDARLRTTLAPLRDALSVARDLAKEGRKKLIEEAAPLASRAMERDTPSRLKAIQARWQEQAKAMAISPRDERVLWEQFHATCDSVFKARDAGRKDEDARKHEFRRALEDLCLQLEQLAQETDQDDQTLRRVQRELQEKWNRQPREAGPGLRDLESRFRKAKTTVDAMVSARARSSEAAVWGTLAAKERLCDELDGLVQAGAGVGQAAAEFANRQAATQEKWAALPALPAAWEQKILARRDAALHALGNAAAANEHVKRMAREAEPRRQVLLALELSQGLDSPEEFQAQRLALQVMRLKDRFKGTAAAADNADEQLLGWCARPGVAGELDRQRCERIFLKIGTTRVKA
jgi:exonuclease SbcC